MSNQKPKRKTGLRNLVFLAITLAAIIFVLANK